MTEQSSLIPNTFQHPNLYIDRLAHLLTPQEQVVLNKAVREILGWQNKRLTRQANISLSVFVDGKFDSNGNRLCYGCGLGTGSVRTALKTLDKFKILLKDGEPTQDGQLYTLQIDSEKIDWQGLENRKAGQDQKRRRQTSAATRARIEGVVERYPIEDEIENDEGVVERQAGVTLDDNKETQLETKIAESPNGDSGKPKKQCQKKQAEKTPTPKGVLVFRSIARRYPAKEWYDDVALIIGEDDTSLELWGRIIKAWVGLGWNPTNVVGMLDFFKRKEIPPGNGRSGNGQGARAAIAPDSSVGVYMASRETK